MNVLKITLSIASLSVHPFTFDLFSKTLAEIILHRRRARFCPDTHLIILRLPLIPECFTLFLPILRLMQNENVYYPFFLLFALPFGPLRSASRGVMKQGVEKLSPRFHPNVTDLTSRGDAARFPQIIILLSYNSFNSRVSKTGPRGGSKAGMLGSLYRPSGERLRYALNERRRDAVAHGNVEIGTFCRRDSTMIPHDRNSRESSVT